MQKTDSDISGHWIFHSTIEGGVTGKGVLVKRVEEYELAVQLIQEGNVLRGMYLGATEGMCGKASLSGTVENNEIEWLVEYIDCSDIKKTFKGKVVKRGKTISIEGNTTPMNTPSKESSWSGYETFIGTPSRTRIPSSKNGIIGKIRESTNLKPGIFGFSIDLKKLIGKGSNK